MDNNWEPEPVGSWLKENEMNNQEAYNRVFHLCNDLRIALMGQRFGDEVINELRQYLADCDRTLIAMKMFNELLGEPGDKDNESDR